MSSPLRSPGTAAMMLGGGAVVVVGIAAIALGSFVLGVGLAVVGLAIEIGGAAVHDRGHRQRGEVPHAMWGKGDRNRPSWLASRR